MREPQVAGLLVLVLVLVAASGCAGTRPEPVWPFHESTGEIDAGVNPPENAYPGPYSAREAISLIAAADPGKGLEPGTVTVKEDAPASESAEELRAKTQNPIGAMISLPLEGSLDFGAPNGSAFVLNVQPVIPVTVGEWNLINRTIVPLVLVDGFIEGLPGIPAGTSGDGAWGLGDINHTTFLSPADPGDLIWGAGLSLTLPTATDPQLGTEKWSVGPSVVFLGQPKPWTLGILMRQLWSFAGADDRQDVNQFLVQPFINYNLDDGWYLTSSPIITANWDADEQWTVPVGGGVGKMLTLGDQPVNTRIQFFYNVARPEAAPDWSIMFTIQFLFPK